MAIGQDNRANALGVTKTQGNRRRGAKRKIRGLGKIKKKELTPFTLRLAAMLDAGLPLVQCLDALGEQTENLEFKRIVNDLNSRISGGDSFAEALTPYRELFGDLYISMVKAGELGGALAEVLGRVGGYMEATEALIRRVKSAMTYPVMVLGLATILALGMILFIVPKFAAMYEDFGSNLPTPTQMLVDVSDFLRANFLLFAGSVFGVIYVSRHLIKNNESIGYAWDQYILKSPVAGILISKVALGRMARTFASLIRSGVPIIRTFEIIAEGIGNKFYQRALNRAGKDVAEGGTIAASLKRSGVFPPMMIHMVSAGEKTGNVDGMLEKVADFYEDEAANTLESLSSMIEPLLMAFLGVVIGGIVICMFLPIFKLSQIVA